MSSTINYQDDPDLPVSVINKQGIDDAFIEKLRDLEYTHRPDIHGLATLEALRSINSF